MEFIAKVGTLTWRPRQ